MKKLTSVVIALVCGAMLGGCTTHTPLGECYGVLSQEKRNEKLIYDYSVMNIFMALIFSETLIVPGIVLLDDLKCPVAVKP